MAKIKVSIVNAATLKLEEKGDIGDIIDLKELHTVDNSSIIDAIQTKKDATYQALIEKEIKQQEMIKKNELHELENQLKQKYEDMKNEKERLSMIVESFDSRLSTEKDSTKTTLNAEFMIEKNKLEDRIKSLERLIDEQKQLIILETEKNIETEYSKKLNDLNTEVVNKDKIIDQLKNDLNVVKDQSSRATALLEAQKKAELSDAISKLEKENEQLKAKLEGETSRSALSVSEAISNIKDQINQKEQLIIKLQ